MAGRSLPQFSQRIRRIARGVETNMNLTAQLVAIAIDQAVVLATPVDTGRARANWQVSVIKAETDVVNGTDPGGSATISKGANVISRKRLGQDIFITNNLPYIVPLNEGSSAQAPAMFVERAVAEGQRVAQRAKILKQPAPRAR